MLPDRVSNPGPLTYESGALPIALRGPAGVVLTPPLVDPLGWETYGGGIVLFPPNKSLTCPLPII